MAKRTSKKTTRKSSRRQTPLKRKVLFSSRQITFFAVIFALIAGFAAWRIFAATAPIQTLEAEKMVLPSTGANLAGDPSASGPLPSNLVRMTQPGQSTQLGATIYTTSPIASTSTGPTSFLIHAHAGYGPGVSCTASGSTGPSVLMTLLVDGRTVFDNVRVTGQNWVWYKVNPSKASLTFAGKTSHILRLFYNLDTQNRCISAQKPGNLLVDAIQMYGPGTTEPSLNLSAIPSTISNGQVTTLYWSSANTTGACSASGGWSGGKNQNGSQAVGPLSAGGTQKAYIYNIVCSGPHGTVYASTAVNVVADNILLTLPSAVTPSSDPANATLAPTNITNNSARLWATINPDGYAANYYFQYHACQANNPPPANGGNTGGCKLVGATSQWLNVPTSAEALGSGNHTVNVSVVLTGLSPGTAYVYRVVAVNQLGQSATDTGYLANPATPTTTGTQSFYTAPI